MLVPSYYNDFLFRRFFKKHYKNYYNAYGKKLQARVHKAYQGIVGMFPDMLPYSSQSGRLLAFLGVSRRAAWEGGKP